MSTEVIVAIITGLFTFAGVVVSVYTGNKKTQAQIKSQTDLTIYRIDELEKKTDKHNHMIERMYQAEEHIQLLDERQKDVINRIDRIEKSGKAS